MFRAAAAALTLLIAPCVTPNTDGECPTGYRHLYDKTETGFCVARAGEVRETATMATEDDTVH